MAMVKNQSFWSTVKTIGPKLLPYFKTITIFFVLYPSNSQANLLFLILKCAPIASLCLFILLNGMDKNGFEYSYSRRIFIGLIFSMFGDAFLVYSHNQILDLLGVIAFGLAHIIYLSAFGLRPFNFKIGFMVFMLVTVPLNLTYLPYANQYSDKIMVPVYTSLISVMLWRALSRMQVKNGSLKWTELCCAAGAILFTISDTVLAYDKLVEDLPYDHETIMITYYLAQLGITLSIVNSSDNHEINHRVIKHQYFADVLQKDHSRSAQDSQKEPTSTKNHTN